MKIEYNTRLFYLKISRKTHYTRETMHQHTDNFIQEDTIDIRELWKVLVRRKKLIALVTGTLTLLAVIYALVATPWYEAKAFVEIGTYKQGGKEVLLADSNKLAKRLEVEYIDILENIKDRDVKITAVKPLKKNASFIEIKALGKSNELSQSEVSKVLNQITQKHQAIVSEIKESRESHLNDIKRQIFSVKNNELTKLNESLTYEKTVHLPQLKEKLELTKKNMLKNEEQIKVLTDNIRKTQNKNPSLTALNVIERGSLESKISSQEIRLIDIETSIKALENKTIKQLERKIDITIKDKLAKLNEKLSLAEQALLPHNFKNSALVGEVIISDYPVKPKKKLIVIIAFLTGLMLSVFLAFFLEFIQAGKKEAS